MPPKGSKAKKVPPRSGRLRQIAENGEKQKEPVLDEGVVDVSPKKASRTRRGVSTEDKPSVGGENINGKIKEPEEPAPKKQSNKKAKRGTKTDEIEIITEEIASSDVEPEKVTEKKAGDQKKVKSEVKSGNKATAEIEKVSGKRGQKRAVETVSSNPDQAESTNTEEVQDGDNKIPYDKTDFKNSKATVKEVVPTAEQAENMNAEQDTVEGMAGPSKLSRRAKQRLDVVEILDGDDLIPIGKTRGGRNTKAPGKKVAPAARGRKRKAVEEKPEDKDTEKVYETKNLHCWRVDIERNTELDELARNSSKGEVVKCDLKKKEVKDHPKIEEVKDNPKNEEVKDDPKMEEVKDDPKKEEVKDDLKQGGDLKIEEDKKAAKSGQKRGQKNGGDARSAKARKQEPGSSMTPDSSSDFDNSSKTVDGEPWNYKIVSWNINGIRAWLEKDGLDYLHLEQPDVMCVQETKCSAAKLPSELKEIEGYHCHWLAAQKDGYSGVGMLFKKEPISIRNGIGMEEHDSEGRVITAEYEDFYIVTSYTPNAARGLTRLGYRIQWDHAFRDYLKRLDEVKPVVLCGDLNVAHEEIDLANPKNNRKNAGFTQEEREGFSDLLKEGFVDTFRHLYPDKRDAYTFWTYMMGARAKNVGWRIDYFVISERFTKHLCDSAIRKNVFGSDHCPIVLFLHV